MNQEEAFVNAFIRKDKRDRYLSFLSNPRRRREIVETLNHVLPLDHSLATLVPSSQRKVEGILALLKAYGAPAMCHIISDERDIDGLDLPVEIAAQKLYAADWGTIACCIPGQLAYYRSEAPGPHFLLRAGLKKLK